jgi:hypothetical protein
VRQVSTTTREIVAVPATTGQVPSNKSPLAPAQLQVLDDRRDNATVTIFPHLPRYPQTALTARLASS